MFIGDLIEAVLKDLVEMHRLVVAGRHVFTRRENEWMSVVEASGHGFAVWPRVEPPSSRNGHAHYWTTPPHRCGSYSPSVAPLFLTLSLRGYFEYHIFLIRYLRKNVFIVRSNGWVKNCYCYFIDSIISYFHQL